VGHTGTLDPQAEGVLPVCVGRATKLAGSLTAQDKSYLAELVLGITTDTGDTTGAVTSTSDVNVSLPDIEKCVSSFVGGYMQVPPMYSAIKVNGKKLYELARAGKTIEREARFVEIYRIEIKEAGCSEAANCRIWLDIDCGKGTYIRSLCEDIGGKLGCGGTMGALTRTRSGAFALENALRLSEIERKIKEDSWDFLYDS
jgi:tRNA pseudouridine55 synthase